LTLCIAVGCTDSQPRAASSSTQAQDPLSRVPDLVQALEPSVVTILTATGLGSGVIYDTNGTIVTDHHVVASSTTVEVAFADGQRAQGRVQATDPVVDLAIIKVDRPNLPAAKFQVKPPRVGELAIAIGSPLGFAQTVTVGVVSGLHRAIPSQNSGGALVDLLQTDAPISPGNSGGALANADGEVIGINEAYIPPSAGAVSIGFATSAATVVEEVNQLLRTGHAVHAYAGLQPADITPQVAKQRGLQATEGALVVDVVPGGPADQAGIKPGDVITSFADRPIATAEEFLIILRQLSVGQEVPVVVKRGAQELRLTIALTDQPTQ
jgi:S1-C subfamily serine protease